MEETDTNIRKEAVDSLERIKNFKADTLARTEDLGKAFEFSEAIPASKRLIALFEQIPTRMLDELPIHHVKSIKQQADSLYNLFQRILTFNAGQNDASNQRSIILDEIKGYYNGLFDALFNFISYSVSRTVDFKSLETEGRAAIQSIQDQSDRVIGLLGDYQTQAQQTLDKVREAAAEQGVSQQAHYFKVEAEEHNTKAEEWKTITTRIAIALIIYGIIALFLHKLPFVSPNNSYESAQLIASKIVIFFVLTYLLSLSAKNFMSHKHNSLVNKHRQNSLMTFTALVEAAGKEDTRDIILNHAASCIFAQQESGYIKSAANASDISSKTIIETLPKVTSLKVDG